MQEVSSVIRHSLPERIYGKIQRATSRSLYRRPHRLLLPRPAISFSFDDFPVSAIRCGGEILAQRDLRGTYYASLGLQDTQAPTGKLFGRAELERVVEEGHELGCHTFDHRHSWVSSAAQYERSIEANARELSAVFPGRCFTSFSYPIAEPHPLNKRTASRRFAACRGGGQTFNAEIVDLALLRSFFLEKTRGELDPVYRAIDDACQHNGWLIFSTHDVAKNHTPYGCTPAFFEKVVAYAAASDADVLPVAGVLTRAGIA